MPLECQPIAGEGGIHLESWFLLYMRCSREGDVAVDGDVGARVMRLKETSVVGREFEEAV